MPPIILEDSAAVTEKRDEHASLQAATKQPVETQKAVLLTVATAPIKYDLATGMTGFLQRIAESGNMLNPVSINAVQPD